MGGTIARASARVLALPHLASPPAPAEHREEERAVPPADAHP
ncbi:hypothetical protein ACWEKM_09440 [Streptomyces sp. NPDC004752]